MKQQKAIITILVGLVVLLAGAVIYFATNSSLNQNIIPVANIIQETIPSSQSQSTQSTIPVAQSITNSKGLQTYKNEQYGFEFQYPESWPKPKISVGYLSGGYPQEKSKWTINFGIVGKGSCEGADCSQFELGGFSKLNYGSTLTSLQRNEFISEIKETNAGTLKVITYIENGLRADQTALIFGSLQTYKLVNVWGEEKDFNQIISTFEPVD